MNSETIRVLVVEDSQSWLQILSEVLEDMGFQVDTAVDYSTALTQLHTASHRLAVVDLALGNGDVNNQDGLHILEVIQRLDPGCVSIMLTGYATVELAVCALTEYGAFTCLEKSAFNRAGFKLLIRKALASVPPVQSPVEDLQTSSDNVIAFGSELREENQRSILIVEDDAGWRSILSELLVEADYTVKMSSGYGEALGHLQRHHFALAVVDLNLDGTLPNPDAIWRNNGKTSNLEGYQLLIALDKQRVPTIIVSGISVPERVAQTFEDYDIFSYIAKQTFDRKIFLDTVVGALATYQVPDKLQDLTEREMEVLDLLAEGATNKDIADKLFISANTVKHHLKAIFSKLGVHTRSAAAAIAVQARQA